MNCRKVISANHLPWIVSYPGFELWTSTGQDTSRRVVRYSKKRSRDRRKTDQLAAFIFSPLMNVKACKNAFSFAYIKTVFVWSQQRCVCSVYVARFAFKQGEDFSSEIFVVLFRNCRIGYLYWDFIMRTLSVVLHCERKIWVSHRRCSMCVSTFIHRLGFTSTRRQSLRTETFWGCLRICGYGGYAEVHDVNWREKWRRWRVLAHLVLQEMLTDVGYVTPRKILTAKEAKVMK